LNRPATARPATHEATAAPTNHWAAISTQRAPGTTMRIVRVAPTPPRPHEARHYVQRRSGGRRRTQTATKRPFLSHRPIVLCSGLTTWDHPLNRPARKNEFGGGRVRFDSLSLRSIAPRTELLEAAGTPNLARVQIDPRSDRCWTTTTRPQCLRRGSRVRPVPDDSPSLTLSGRANGGCRFGRPGAGHTAIPFLARAYGQRPNRPSSVGAVAGPRQRKKAEVLPAVERLDAAYETDDRGPAVRFCGTSTATGVPTGAGAVSSTLPGNTVEPTPWSRRKARQTPRVGALRQRRASRRWLTTIATDPARSKTCQAGDSTGIEP